MNQPNARIAPPDHIRTEIRILIGACQHWNKRADELEADYFGRGIKCHDEMVDAQRHRDDIIDELREMIPARNEYRYRVNEATYQIGNLLGFSEDDDEQRRIEVREVRDILFRLIGCNPDLPTMLR